MSPSINELPESKLPAPYYEHTQETNGAGSSELPQKTSPEFDPKLNKPAQLVPINGAAPKLINPILQPQTVQPANNLPSGVSSLDGDDDRKYLGSWIARARQVIEETKHDPRAQALEMSRLKAAYLKEQYGKDIKVAEE